MLSRPTSLATTTTTKEFGVLADLTTLSLSLVNCNGTSRYPPLSYSIFFILRRDFNRRVLRALTRTRKPVNLAIACVSLLFFCFFVTVRITMGTTIQWPANITSRARSYVFFIVLVN